MGCAPYWRAPVNVPCEALPEWRWEEGPAGSRRFLCAEHYQNAHIWELWTRNTEFLRSARKLVTSLIVWIARENTWIWVFPENTLTWLSQPCVQEFPRPLPGPAGYMFIRITSLEGNPYTVQKCLSWPQEFFLNSSVELFFAWHICI